MTEQEKRFKIEKITSYQKQISENKKDISESTFGLGTAALCVIVSFMKHPSVTSTTALIGVFNAWLSIYWLKDLIINICKKTMLEGKIEDINTELEMAEMEENQGMTR